MCRLPDIRNMPKHIGKGSRSRYSHPACKPSSAES
nr:MAG TPA: hypothetical protein [Caudoviricetes sp.]